MYNELVHVSCLLSELGRAIAAGFRSAKLVLEERIVLRADDGEVVRHVDEETTRRLCDYYIASKYFWLSGLPMVATLRQVNASGLALPRTAFPKR
jgi:hypothetical protein